MLSTWTATRANAQTWAGREQGDGARPEPEQLETGPTGPARLVLRARRAEQRPQDDEYGRRGGRFADADWISGSPRPEGTLLDAALRQGFRPRIAHVVGEWTAKQGYVAAGLGVTLVPAPAAEAVRPDVVLLPVLDEGAPARAAFVAALRGAAGRFARSSPPWRGPLPSRDTAVVPHHSRPTATEGPELP